MNIQCKVISLVNSERRKSVSEQLELVMQYEFFDAITDADRAFSQFNQSKANTHYQRKLRKGEIGCTLSHQLVTRQEIRNNWLVVLEDDFLIVNESRFRDLLTHLNCIEKDKPCCLLLGHSKTISDNLWIQRLKQPLSDVFSIGQEKFGLNDKVNFCGTVGYIINKAALEVIQKKPIEECSIIADDWNFYRDCGIKIYHPIYPIVYEDLKYFSATGNKVEVEHNILDKPIANSLSIIKNQLIRMAKKLKLFHD